MKKLLATVTFALAFPSFAAQKTSVSVAEPYLFTDETAEISGLPDVKGREGQTSMKTSVPFSTWGGARPGDEIGFQFTWRRRRREGVAGSATIQWFPWEREWTPCGYGRLLRVCSSATDSNRKE